MKTVVYLSKVDEIAVINEDEIVYIDFDPNIDFDKFYIAYGSYLDMLEDAAQTILGDL